MKNNPVPLIILAALTSGCLSSPLTLSEAVDAMPGVDLSPPPPDTVVSPTRDALPDTSPPPVACGPSPITIDRDCGSEPDEVPCQVASGLAKTPCRFQVG